MRAFANTNARAGITKKAKSFGSPKKELILRMEIPKSVPEKFAPEVRIKLWLSDKA
jgi:hypothetical protein